MLRALSLVVKVKTSPDSIGKVQCLANTFLQELQALLNVNTFSFPPRRKRWSAFLAQFGSQRSKACDRDRLSKRTVTV